MKQAKEYCYSPLDGMLVHRIVTHQQYVAGTHLYSERRETKWSKVPCLKKQWDWRGLNIGPLGPEFEVLKSNALFNFFVI